MKNFFKLVKINLYSSFIGKSKRKGLKLLGFGLLFIYLAAVFGGFAFLLADGMKETGNFEFLLVLGNIMSIIFVLIISISTSTNILFKSKDNDMLLSLPMKKSSIVLGKLVSIYTLSMSYALIILLPILVVYFIYSGVTFLSLLCSTIALFVIPILPTIIGVFLSSFFSLFIGKSKHRNLLTTIGLFVFFIAFMVFYYTIDFANLALNAALQENITKYTFYFLPIKWFVSCCQNGSVLSLIWLILLSGVLAYLTCLFVSSTFLRISTAFNSNFSTSKKIEYKKSNIIMSLIKKESQKFFNTSMYIFNSGFGLLLSLAIPVLAIIFRAEVMQVLNMLSLPLIYVVLAVSVAYSLILSTCNTPSISLSLERNCASYLRVYPISPIKIFMSKILFNILLHLPFIIIGTIFASIFFNFGILYGLLMFVTVLFFSALFSVLGMFFNIFFCKTDAINDTIIIKQTTSSFLGVFTPMVLFTIIGLLAVLVFSTNLTIFIIVTFSILIALAVILYCLLFRFANELFKKAKL